jgi:hypothetical protein
MKLVRILNLNVDKYGEPFAICKQHLKELVHRLNGHCVVVTIGTTKGECEDCESSPAQGVLAPRKQE